MQYDTENGTDYTKVWEALESPVSLVLDEEGNNPSNGRVRNLLGKYWLYCDDMDGYEIYETREVQRWILKAE
jgi:hypothetical protein